MAVGKIVHYSIGNIRGKIIVVIIEIICNFFAALGIYKNNASG